MAKLTLHLEKLRVDSFPTDECDRTLRGTVQAHQRTRGCGPTLDEYCSQVYVCMEEPSMGCPPSEYTCTVVAPC